MSERRRTILLWSVLGLCAAYNVAVVKGWVARPSDSWNMVSAAWASGFLTRWAFEILKEKGRAFKFIGAYALTGAAAMAYWTLAFLGVVPRWWPIFAWQVR